MNIGAQLRASREARGLSIDALAHATRVQPRILAAIERNDVAAVPPRPFGRGFVRAYAQEIGLNPDETARAYFAQFAPAVQTPEPAATDAPLEADPAGRRSRVAIAIGGLAIVALLVFISRASRTPAAEPPPAIGTSGSASASTVPAPVAPETVARTASTQAPAPVPTDAPTASPLSIVLTAERPAWVSARADGRRVLYQRVLPGTPVTIDARELVTMRVGDAGALSWRINGRDAGRLGKSGQVRDIRLTPQTAAAQ